MSAISITLEVHSIRIFKSLSSMLLMQTFRIYEIQKFHNIYQGYSEIRSREIYSCWNSITTVFFSSPIFKSSLVSERKKTYCSISSHNRYFDPSLICRSSVYCRWDDASSAYFDSASSILRTDAIMGFRPKRAKHVFSHPETGLQQSNFSLALLARCNLSLQVTEGPKDWKKHLKCLELEYTAWLIFARNIRLSASYVL